MSIEPSTSDIIAAINADVHCTPQTKIARVFCLENSQNVNVAMACEYGPIFSLFTSTNNGNKFSKSKERLNCPSMWETKKFQDAIIKKLEENKFNPEIDYVLIAGHVVPLIIFAVTLATEFESVNFLLWNSPMRKYEVRRL